MKVKEKSVLQMLKGQIRRSLYIQLLESTDFSLNHLDELMDIACSSGLGQNEAPDGLKQGFQGVLSHATQIFQDSVGNWWYNKKYSDGDFWIIHDELLTAVQGHKIP